MLVHELIEALHDLPPDEVVYAYDEVFGYLPADVREDGDGRIVVDPT